ncbi:MAG: beta strand repeat-containing protein [Acidovorax defluvii]
MALTTTQKTEAYQFFIVAFGAATGVEYMNQLNDAYNAGMTTKQIVNVYTTKPQFETLYPRFDTNEQFAERLIENVVGASATAAAKTEAKADVAAALNAGWTKGDIVFQIFTNLAAKASTDAQWGKTSLMLANKVAVAQYITETQLVNTTDLTKLSSYIASVTEVAASVDAAKLAAQGANGQTFTLTASIDNFTGTAGNDIFVGDNTQSNGSAGPGDQINGGAGNDTLKLFAAATATTLNLPQLKGVENLYVKGGAAIVDNISTIADVTAIELDSQTATGTLTLKGTQAATLSNNTVGQNLVYGATDTVASVTVNNVTGGAAVDVRGAALATLNLAATGANSAITLNNSVGTKLTTLTITGDKNLSVTESLNGLTTVDASAATGNVTLVATAAVNDITVTGGKGSDTINLGANFTKADKVNGGDGTDTLELTQASVTTVNGYTAAEKIVVNDNLSNLEVLKVTDALTSNVDASRFDNINSFVFAGGNNAGGTATLSKVTSGVSVEMNAAAGAVTNVLAVEIIDATLAGNNSDIVNLKLNDTVAAVAGVTDYGVLNAVGTGNKIDIAATSSALDKIVVTGNLALDISDVALVNSIGEVDASGLVLSATTANGLSVAIANGGTNGVKITGSNGVDTIQGSAAADIIDGGAGNDLISGALATYAAGTFATLDGNTAADVLTGGAGNDQFGFGLGSTTVSFNTIKDLNLGTAAVAGQVDKLVFDVATAGAATIVSLSAAQQATVTAAADLAAAADAALVVAATAGNVVQFTYGTDTYLLVNGVTATANYTAGEDHLVKITGVVGTLDASDIVLF